MKNITRFYLKTLYTTTKGSCSAPKFEDGYIKFFFKKHEKNLYLNCIITIDEDSKLHLMTLETNKSDKVNHRLLLEHYRYGKHDLRDFVKNKTDVLLAKEEDSNEQW